METDRITEDKVTEIFCRTDDFCPFFTIRNDQDWSMPLPTL